MPLRSAISRLPRPLSRRAALRWCAVAGSGVAGAVLAACSARSNRPAGAPIAPPRTPARPDPQLLDRRAEVQLLALYDATIKAHPALAARLGPLRTDHTVHLSALERLLGGGREKPATAPRPVPADQAAALQALRTAEQAAAAARTRSCVAAEGKRSGLLGSIAASEASHVELLS